jgi:hypothetical protein
MKGIVYNRNAEGIVRDVDPLLAFPVEDRWRCALKALDT